MVTVSPRHVLCLLGNWTDFKAVSEYLDAEYPDFTLDTEYSQLTPDSRMPQAFKLFQDRLTPTMTEADWLAIEKHRAVAYVLSPHLNKSNSKEVSGRSLQLVANLLANGAVAAKSESAGLAHGKDQWLASAQEYTNAIKERDIVSIGSALYTTWVQRCLRSQDGDFIYSVGMHLLGHRDAEFEAPTDPVEAIRWIDLLGYYLLENQDTTIDDGEGFRLVEDGPRRVVEQVPCLRYESDDFFHNPYGYNRLVDDPDDTRPWWRFW